jgi:hypothetical protein
MSCFENNNTAVTPFVLCSLCRKFVELYTNGNSWEAIPRISRENAEDYFPRFQHHDPSTALHASAESGCHLCTQIDASINHLRGDIRDKYEGYLVPVLTRDGPYNEEGCSRFEIGVELGANHIRAMISIHRHTYGKDNEEGPIFPCLLWYRGLIKDSLETQAGWSTNTCSSSSFAMLRSWLRQCIDDHEICRLSLSRTKPTRVLDLQAFPATDFIRMVETHEVNMDVTYAALSYRWSSTTDFVLTKSNYEEYRSQIPQKCLPRSIREAVEICRNLGIRYLWVDALCVIQGDSTDFMHEVAQMGSIYANSVFTLEASDATDSQCTFSKSRNPLRVEPFVFAGADKHVYWAFEALLLDTNLCGDRHIRTIQDARISSRGWVFQEQVMAPRTIHFASGEFLWSCREETFCRMCLSQKSPHHISGFPRPKWFGKDVFFTLLAGSRGPEERLKSRRAWGDLIQEFSRTDFTDLDDRLSALAGIAQLIHSYSGLEASYGIRLDFFLDDLRWYSASNSDLWDLRARFGKLAACIPSWSWLSFAGPVLFKKIGQPEEGIEELLTAQITSYPAATAFRQISFLHSQRLQPPSFRICGKIHICQLFPWDFYGQRIWDFIPRAEEQSSAMKNLIQQAWDIHEKSGTDNLIKMCAPLKDNLPRSFIYCPDTRSQHRRDVTCLLLSRTWDHATVSDFGLVLEPVYTGSTTYRRVGSFQSRLSDWEYQDWLKDLVRGRFYPHLMRVSSYADNASSLEDDVASRDPSFDISELDIFDNIMRDLERLKQEKDSSGANTLEHDLCSRYAVDLYVSSSKEFSSSKLTQSAGLNRLASLIKCLRIFNGTEEEAEIEIV